MHVSVGTQGVQTRILDLLELELYMLASHLVWVLGPELRSLGRTMQTLNH